MAPLRMKSPRPSGPPSTGPRADARHAAIAEGRALRAITVRAADTRRARSPRAARARTDWLAEVSCTGWTELLPIYHRRARAAEADLRPHPPGRPPPRIRRRSVLAGR